MTEMIMTYILYGGSFAAMLILIRDMKNTKSSETMFYSRAIVVALIVGFVYSIYYNTPNIMGLAWVLTTVFIAVSVGVNKIEAITTLIKDIKSRK